MRQSITILFFILLAICPAYSQTTLLQEADSYFDQGKYNHAIQKYEQAKNSATGIDQKENQIIEIKIMKAKNCAKWITKADNAFNAEQYSTAKKIYQDILESNPKDEYTKLKIEKCNKELNPPPTRTTTNLINNQKQYSSTQENQKKHSNISDNKPATIKQTKPATYINLSKKDLYFNAESGDKQQVNVFTDAENFTIPTAYIPKWCVVKIYEGYFTVSCRENDSFQERKDWFWVMAGEKDVKIYIHQSGSNNFKSTQTYSSDNINRTYHSNNINNKTYRRKSSFNYPKNYEQWGISMGFIKGELMNGILAGIRFEPLFKYGFGINTGLNYEYYSTKFAKSSYKYQRNNIDKYQEHILNIPLHAEYRFNISKYFNLFIYGGAAIECATNSDFSQYTFRTALEYGGGIRMDRIQLNAGRSNLIYENGTYAGLITSEYSNVYKVFTISMSYMF